MNMDHKVSIFVGVIGVIGTIAGAIIGANFGKNNITIILPDGIEATLNSEQIKEIVYENEGLQAEQQKLKAESDNVIKENQNQLLTISELEEENNNLKSQIEELKTENENLRNDTKSGLENTTKNSEMISTDSNKVDIFKLQPFVGKLDDFIYSASGSVDNLGNKYPGGYEIYCNSNGIKKSLTYVVDQEYRAITGTIALNNGHNSIEYDIWIEFYSDGSLIGETQHLHSGIRPQEFYIDISGVDELEIVARNEKDYGLNGAYILTNGFFLIE